MNPGHTLPSHFIKTTFNNIQLSTFCLPSSLLTLVFATKNLHSFIFSPVLTYKKWFQMRLIICPLSNLLMNENSKWYCETNKRHAETCVYSAAIFMWPQGRTAGVSTTFGTENIPLRYRLFMYLHCALEIVWRNFLFWHLRQRNLHQAGIIPPY
jgi:hypothetical protein